jgi:hypothetical protein
MGLSFERILLGAKGISARWLKARKRVTSAGGSDGSLYKMLSSKSQTANSLNPKIQESDRIKERFDLDYSELTEKNLRHRRGEGLREDHRHVGRRKP